MSGGLTYKDAGVDVDLEAKASEIFYEASRETWDNRKGKLGEVFMPFPDFSGLRGIDVSGLPPGTIMLTNYDGIGTKMEIAERVGKFDTMAFDLTAMLSDDSTRYNAESVLLGSVVDINRLWKGSGKDKVIFLDYVQQLADGMVAAAKEANVAVINGEIAELGKRVSGYGDFNTNWGGSVISFARRDRLLTGLDIEPGDKLVALRENGPRSNGISLLRKTLEKEYGEKWHEEKLNGKNLGELVIEASTIYTSAIMDMDGGFEGEPKAKVNGIVNVTGGGMPEKLGRLLKPRKLGAFIEDTFEPCEVMLHCQEIGKITDEESYKTWNMGQGTIVDTPEPDNVIRIAKKHGIEAKVVGEVDNKTGIAIASKGYYDNGLVLEFK